MDFVHCPYCGKEADRLIDDLVSQPIGHDDWDPKVRYLLERCSCGALERVTIARQSVPPQKPDPS